MCAGLPLGSAVAEKTPTVLATIKPLHSLASAVTDGISEVQLLIGSNTSPHLFQIKPSHIRSVIDADVVVWAGEGVERFLPSMMEKFNEPATLLEMAELDGAIVHKSRSTREVKDLATMTKAESESNEGHAHPAHGNIDYHLWLDPHNALLLVDKLAIVLAEKDAANAERYLSNAALYKKRLDATAEEVRNLLTGTSAGRYLVYHDSLQYLEKAFGLGRALVVTAQPQVQAGGKRLRELHKEVADIKPRCLIAEPQFRSPVLKILAEELGLQAAAVDPLAIEFNAGADLYHDWLIDTATTLAECFADE